MMLGNEKIAVTGATGNLGNLVVRSLLKKGVPAGNIVAIVRNAEKAADLAAFGVEIREADYSLTETLPAAVAEIDKLLLVSASEPGKRAPQHRNVIDAAKAAGVKLLAYTGSLNSDTSTFPLADEHKQTEKMIRESGIPFVFLRNGWYIENYAAAADYAVKTGKLVGTAGDGLISAATRADLADAAAAVLTGSGFENTIHELGGDDAFTYSQLAGVLTEAAEVEVVYEDIPEAEFADLLEKAGVPSAFAEVLATSESGMRRGEMYTESGDLARLIGRPTEPLYQALERGLLIKEMAAAA